MVTTIVKKKEKQQPSFSSKKTQAKLKRYFLVSSSNTPSSSWMKKKSSCEDNKKGATADLVSIQKNQKIIKRPSSSSFFSAQRKSSSLKENSTGIDNRKSRFFGDCPLCGKSLPLHLLESHASSCGEEEEEECGSVSKELLSTTTATFNDKKPQDRTHLHGVKIGVGSSEDDNHGMGALERTTLRKRIKHPEEGEEEQKQQQQQQQQPFPSEILPPPSLTTTTTTTISVQQPIPGLFLLEDFLTEEEERLILSELDGLSKEYRHEFLPWKLANFNGPHLGKRWGVHCNLRDRKVSEPENPLPNFIRQYIVPKLLSLLLLSLPSSPFSSSAHHQQQVNQNTTSSSSRSSSNSSSSSSSLLRRLATVMIGGKRKQQWKPNEANAIEYYRKRGHYLSSHIDDRKLSTEPIVNLSLAGECYMTFRNTASHRNTAPTKDQRVLLKRRCLQVLTGKARYDFSHGIRNEDLLSDRRVSITIRESPLTTT